MNFKNEFILCICLLNPCTLIHMSICGFNNYMSSHLCEYQWVESLVENGSNDLRGSDGRGSVIGTREEFVCVEGLKIVTSSLSKQTRTRNIFTFLYYTCHHGQKRSFHTNTLSRYNHVHYHYHHTSKNYDILQ